ncbi:MAG TPA: HDOD domain-containing protein, partial [Fimbriimonas sp.]|nr:HDOD domain-containing protein [Fimbriimonas sp.]
YPQLLRTHGEREIHVHERELYGTTHAEIGAFLLGLWGLPLSIVTNVADHHTPSKIRQSTVLSTLEIATGLAYGSTYEETFDLARSGQLAPLNLSESAIANLTECQKPNAA